MTVFCEFQSRLVVCPHIVHRTLRSLPVDWGDQRPYAVWPFFVLGFVASMLIAGQMARARTRSIRAWVWVTAVIGPLGPATLHVLGNRSDKASHA